MSDQEIEERWRNEVASLAGREEAMVTGNLELHAWANVLGYEFCADLRSREPHAGFVRQFPIEFSRRHKVLPLVGGDENTDGLEVAVTSHQCWASLDVIGRTLGVGPFPVFVPEEELLRSINNAYQERAGLADDVMDQMGEADVTDVTHPSEVREDLLENSGSPPIVSLVNSILFDAVRSKASDVHIQPTEDRVIVRERIDGVLFESLTVPKSYQDEIISRFKVIARMDIAEKRLPQDGRASVRIGDRLVDLRVASLPTSFGERVVVRFLDKSARLYSLQELGMDASTLLKFRRLIRFEHGLLLVTGPTGSGKSTTLYAALQEINSNDLNVLTLEDPIEYQLEGVSQTQINLKKGLTFASGLRNVLRQDPDIIMVGEIRDEETAMMGIQSALTGHFVFSTLHTNDAASAVTRLLDLGIEPFLVASSAIAVIAQRLVRRVCRECCQLRRYSETELEGLGLSVQLAEEEFARGVGCPRCRETGYQGRVGIFELLEVTDSIRHQIQMRSNAADIRSIAVTEGAALLAGDALQKARAGVTTLEEVARVAMRF